MVPLPLQHPCGTVPHQSFHWLISTIRKVLWGSESRGIHVGFKSFVVYYVPLLLERWFHMSANSVDENISRLRGCSDSEWQDVAVRRVLRNEAIGMLGGWVGSLDQYMRGNPQATIVKAFLPTESSSVLLCHATILPYVNESSMIYRCCKICHEKTWKYFRFIYVFWHILRGTNMGAYSYPVFLGPYKFRTKDVL